ncbi:MAG: response regulator [Bacteroidota bacterium]
MNDNPVKDVGLGSLYKAVSTLSFSQDRLSICSKEVFNALSSKFKLEQLVLIIPGLSGDWILYQCSDWDSNEKKWMPGGDFFSQLIDEGSESFLSREDLTLQKKGPSEDLSKFSGWVSVPVNLKEEIGLLGIFMDTKSLKSKAEIIDLLGFIALQTAIWHNNEAGERKIKEQSARLNAIFQSSNHMIWSVNKHFDVTSFNKNFHQFIYGFYGESLRATFRGVPINNQQYSNFWHNKYDEAFSGKRIHFETSFGKEESLKIWLDVYLNPILGINGQIEEVSVIAHDITNNKIAEKHLQQSEAKFRTIFESFQDIYFRCDFKGHITMISPSVYDLAGYEIDEVLKKDITNHYLYNSKTKDLIRQLIRSKSVRNFEASVITKTGEILNCICNVRLIYDRNNRPFEIEGVARDISSLKKANQELVKQKEIAEKSLKVKEQFLANMSHEIRTPMNGVIGMIDLMSRTRLDDKQEYYVQTIKRSSETLMSILNDILDLSKIEAGKMRLRKAPLSIKTLLEKIIALFLQKALSKSIKLEFNVNKEVPETVKSDETRLIQVLSNLTSNAIKFTNEGGHIEIRVTLDEEKKRGKQKILKFEIHDNGIGISKKNQSMLFKNFSQVDGSSTKSHGGTGLGLVISKQLTRLMGGKIGVESEVGKGSIFWFTIKAEETQEKPEVGEDKSDASDFSDIIDAIKEVEPKILLVDDNKVNRDVAREILKSSGAQVIEAKNGHEAIEFFKKNEFSTVLMDIQMPGIDGVETTKRIKKLHNKKVTPVIAMTAYSMKEDRDKYLRLGMDEYVSKPIKAENLLSTVAKSIGLVSNEKNSSTGSFKELKEKLIVDQEVLEQLKKYGGLEMVKEALEDFEKETDELLNKAEELFQENSIKELERSFHTIKGNAGTLGVNKVAGYAATVEKKIKEEKTEDLFAFIKELRLSFEEFKEYLKQNF